MSDFSGLNDHDAAMAVIGSGITGLCTLAAVGIKRLFGHTEYHDKDRLKMIEELREDNRKLTRENMELRQDVLKLYREKAETDAKVAKLEWKLALMVSAMRKQGISLDFPMDG